MTSVGIEYNNLEYCIFMVGCIDRTLTGRISNVCSELVARTTI